jgi:hypothetical protein
LTLRPAQVGTHKFLYYFIGMVISRAGSLVFAPLLKKTGFVVYTEYKDFVAASKEDEKLDILSEANNTYRTFCSLFLIVGSVKLYETLARRASIPEDTSEWVLFLVLFLLFAFAYRKQTKFITQRIEASRQ